MGTFEIVLKRAWPCSSRLVPVGAPMGFSGALSSVGTKVLSAQSFSDCAGLRLSKTSEIGLSATVCFFISDFSFFSDMRLPMLGLMIAAVPRSDKEMNRPSGWQQISVERRLAASLVLAL